MNKRIRINGVLYEAVEQLDEATKKFYFYGCPFELDASVSDIRQAQRYLDDDIQFMLQIFNERTTDSTGAMDDPIINWRWKLTSKDSGYFVYETYRKLTDQEIDNLGECTLGQASDGLGEGFAQQDFANYTVYHRGRDGDDDYEDTVMASFKWKRHRHGYDIQELDKSYAKYLR